MSSCFGSFSGIKNFFFPVDKPSPLFALWAHLLNSTIVVTGFTRVLGEKTCESLDSIGLGIVNGITNMLFSSFLIWFIRKKIDQGIPKERSSLQIMAMDPIVIFYLLFLVWQVCWMVWNFDYSRKSEDPCVYAASIQICVLLVYLPIAVIFFVFTFYTEICRVPRWRLKAEAKFELHRRENPRTTMDEPPSMEEDRNLTLRFFTTTDENMYEDERHIEQEIGVRSKGKKSTEANKSGRKK